MGLIAVDAFARRLTGSEEEEEEAYVKVIKIGLVLVLAALSAVFSGLNLGLMCLDANQLEMLIKAGKRSDADKEALRQGRWARRILPLRRDGNVLLCTVLLGNVMVNSYMAILLSEFSDGAIAFVASTLIIVTFGEILPQSICYKHGLRIGAALVPLVLVFWYVLLPVTKPIAFVLDRVFGEEMGQVLDRQQLMALIDYQQKMAPHLLTEWEANILRGSLDFSSMDARQIMVPLGDCFCIDANAIINPGLCAAVAEAGFSRIPVIDRDPKAPKRQFQVVGLFHVKDILLIDVDHDIPLKALLPLIGRELFIVEDDSPLPELMDQFRQGATQLAVVRGLVDEEDCDPYFRHLGIVTLQDLLNTIVKDDIHEVDAADDDSEISSVPSGMYSNVQRYEVVRAQRPRVRAARHLRVRGLSHEEVVAAAAFLRRRHRALFVHEAVTHELLEAFLLRDCRLVGEPPEASADDVNDERALYRRGEVANFATLVISGDVKVFSGGEGFESLHGPFSLLGKRCLELCVERATGGTEKTTYAPDFTAHTADEKDGSGTRLLIITAEAYTRLFLGQKRRSSKEGGAPLTPDVAANPRGRWWCTSPG